MCGSGECYGSQVTQTYLFWQSGCVACDALSAWRAHVDLAIDAQPGLVLRAVVPASEFLA